MKLDLYQVDAFASKPFEGNPAAICPLDEWLPDEVMRNIAAENNLSETAFFIPQSDSFALRWFTPEAEVELCGHATLATAHVIFQHLNYRNDKIRFCTKSGELFVTRSTSGYQMDFPATLPELVATPNQLIQAIGIAPIEVRAAYDYVILLESQEAVENLAPNYSVMSQLDLRGLVVTAPGREVDFVSRCFFPKLKVDEDPVTGSAHCELAPLWAQKLNKNRLIAKQVSLRSGIVRCEVRTDRVLLTGNAADYLHGQITL